MRFSVLVYCVAVAAFGCAATTLAADDMRQPLTREELESLREYLQTRDAPGPDEDADTYGAAETQEKIDQQQAEEERELDERTIDDSDIEEDALRENYVGRDVEDEQRGWSGFKSMREKWRNNKEQVEKKRKELLQQKVVKAEKYRFDNGGRFGTDVGVVVTLEDGRRLLIRKTGNGSSSVRCWGRRRGRDCRQPVSVISADFMSNKWEVSESKVTKSSTVDDYVKASKAARTRAAAVDDMMKLE